MQKVTVAWLVGLLAMSVAGQVLAQTQQTITVGDIVNNPDRWDNRTVTLVGEIRNPVEAAEVGRGTYDLRDERGNTITVRTAALPGADQMQGKFQVRGEVGLDNLSNCFLWESSRQPWRPPVEGPVTPEGADLWTYLLIGGGVVLAGLIVLLVVLLTKKPAPLEPVVVEPGTAHLGDTVEAPVAPSAAVAETREYSLEAAAMTREFYGATVAVEEGPDAGKTFALSKRSSTIGRLDDRDIRLTDPTVSREHARILAKEDGSLQLINESTKGTLVNGVEVDSKILSDGDRIQMAGTVLSVKLVPRRGAAGVGAPGAAAPTQEFAGTAVEPGATPPAPGETQEFLGVQIEVTGGPHAGEAFVLSKSATLIGRQNNQDIVLAKDRTVSREHCEIRHRAGEFTLVSKPDKKVLVNGEEQVTCSLADGDEIQLGGTKLRFVKL